MNKVIKTCSFVMPGEFEKQNQYGLFGHIIKKIGQDISIVFLELLQI